MTIDRTHAPWRPALLAVCLLAQCGCGLIGSAVSTTVNTATKLAVPAASAKLAFGCLPEGTRIDTPEGPVAVEKLRAGDLVVGFGGEAVRILMLHAYAEDTATEYLAVELEDGARVESSGMHRIGGVRAKDLAEGGEVAGRRIERITRRAGVARSYDLLTEDAGYRISGVPVNSMIQEMAAAARTGSRPGK